MTVEGKRPRLEIKKHINSKKGSFLTGLPAPDDTNEVDAKRVLDEINSMSKYHVRKARGHSGRSKKRQR